MPEIAYKNAVLSYLKTGTGPVVVLLHGFAEDSRVWSEQVEALTGFTLLIPDLPGSGASGAVDDMSMEGLAEAVYRLLLAENVTSCVLIGHSMGGYVALAFAEKYSRLLKGFGLFHSTAYPDTEAKKGLRRKGISFIQEHGVGAFVKTSVPDLFSPLTGQQSPQLIDEQIKAAHSFSAGSLVSYYKAMIARPDRTSVLKNLTVPVLFILGSHDKAVPLQDGLRQSHIPEISYIHILNDSAHMGMKEEKEATNTILLQYLLAIERIASTT